MPWKTVKLKIGEEFGLNQADLYIDITPITWLPEETMFALTEEAIKIAHWQTKLRDMDIEISEESVEGVPDAEKTERIVQQAQDRISMMRAMFNETKPIIERFFIETVTGWNLKNDDGSDLPLPRDLEKQSSLGLISKLIPLPVRMHVVQCAQDPDGGQTIIPLGNEKPSNDSSAPVATLVSAK